jgi:DNA polymerase-3 subunit epsilon
VKHPTFVALDFETADSGRDSACAVAAVKVRNLRVVREASYLIRPPRPYFEFSHIHGITWSQVADKPRFRGVWLDLRELLSDADFIAAHYASFDRSVMLSCCSEARLRPPDLAFCCTVKLSRRVWGYNPTALPDVCRRLRIPLRHHDPLSDARACARIMIAAITRGVDLDFHLNPPRKQH